MSSNKSLLAKADLALSDLSSNGGLLNPEQANTFLKKLIKQPTLLQQTRFVTMSSPTRKINKIGFGSRILRKAPTAGTSLTQGQRAKPNTEQIELNTDEVIAEVRIPYDVMEDNIESAAAANNEASNTGPSGLRTTIIGLIGERAALDLEELALLADTDYTNGGDQDDEDYLSMTDGFLKIAGDQGNYVDVENALISKSVFKKGLKVMPDQYLRNRAAMKHFVSYNQEVDYQDSLANRSTALGDQKVSQNTPAWAYGSLVEAVSLMPDDQGLYTHPKNLIMGVQRNISMEYDKDITARVYIIVLTARIAFQVEEAEALVAYGQIGSE